MSMLQLGPVGTVLEWAAGTVVIEGPSKVGVLVGDERVGSVEGVGEGWLAHLPQARWSQVFATQDQAISAVTAEWNRHVGR